MHENSINMSPKNITKMSNQSIRNFKREIYSHGMSFTIDKIIDFSWDFAQDRRIHRIGSEYKDKRHKEMFW